MADDIFDFSEIKVQDTEDAPGHSGGARRKYETNPFEGPIDDAIVTGKGKEVVLPPKAIKDAITLLRQAGDDRNKGVKINLYAKGKRILQTEIDSLAPNVRVTLKFWAAEKRTYTRPNTRAFTPDEAADLTKGIVQEINTQE